MINLDAKGVIFWDFDGVIMDSMLVRDQGFVEVLQDFPEEQIAQLLDFHRANGGLSRYVKFKYFFESIRSEKVSNDDIDYWAVKFSSIMKSLLTNRQLLIDDTLKYIEAHHNKKVMHIVSGSDQNELRYLCANLGIDDYFKSIHGSPTPKIKLVQDLLETECYDSKECVLIGDSINDFEAAHANGVDFLAYNNAELESIYQSFNTWLI